jgi:hypothetical protein
MLDEERHVISQTQKQKNRLFTRFAVHVYVVDLRNRIIEHALVLTSGIQATQLVN